MNTERFKRIAILTPYILLIITIIVSIILAIWSDWVFWLKVSATSFIGLCVTIVIHLLVISLSE